MSDDYDDNEPIRVNFADVPGKKVFYLLPSGKYIAEVTDYTRSVVSEESDNAGADMFNWEFTIESTESGETEITARVRNPETKQAETTDIKVEGRRVYDNMVVVEASFWRMRDFLDACWYDTSGEMEIFPDEIIGNRLILEVAPQQAKKNRKTGQEYKARNRVVNFFPLDTERPADTPDPEPAKAKEKKAKVEAEPTTEEAKV